MKLDKKKITVLVLGILTLLVLIGSASYAFYSISVMNNTTKTMVKGKTTAIDNIALKNAGDNIHIILNNKDMNLENTRDYYAVTEEDKNYDIYEHGIELAELEAKGGDARAAYDCEVKVTVSKKEDDTMISELKEGETELYITYGNVSETYDLFNLKNGNTKEFNGNITLINNSSDFIHSYLKVINNDDDQTHLAGKKLSIDIDTEVTKCDVIGTSKIELFLRNTNTSNTLSKELKGGMYRYQGTAEDVTDNYICFGTDNKDTCLQSKDKFMYRIIGVTPEGKLKVIKKEALDKTYQWYTDYDHDIEFPESKIYEAIKGSDFLENPDFVPVGWEEKIATNTWMYGDMQSNDTLGAKQEGSELYKAETGKKATKWYNYATAETPGAKQATVGYEDSKYKGQTVYYTNDNGNWTQSFTGKVSLMYLHDYYLSVSNTANCQYDDKNYVICQTGWMHLSNNDTGALSPHEWTMSRHGWDHYGGWFNGLVVYSDGSAHGWSLSGRLSIRPVFFLNNDIEISGKGTETEPYMIKLENE